MAFSAFWTCIYVCLPINSTSTVWLTTLINGLSYALRQCSGPVMFDSLSKHKSAYWQSHLRANRTTGFQMDVV